MRILKPLPGTLPMPIHNIVGDWPMSSLGGRVFDLSYNGQIGTLFGGVTWPIGQFGRVLNFPGTDDWIDLAGLIPYSSSQPHSYIAWVRPTALNIYEWVLNNDAQDNNSGDSLVLRSTGTVGFFHKGGNQIINSVGTVAINLWSQIAVVLRSVTELDFYINGLFDSTVAPLDTWLADNNNPRIGAWGNGAWDFHGDIDDVQVYNRALLASEIARLYREAFHRYPENRVFAVA